MERLPFQIVEELKTKSLYAFIVPEKSTCNKISLLIYENQKYRSIIGSWGSVIGVHLFPSIDRRPYTNEVGNKYLSGSLEDVQPINGFKWTDPSWELLVEKGVTDDEGWQYARSWSNLRDHKRQYDYQRATSFVRRRRWRRTMEINLESVHQSLPYELFCRVQLTAPQASTTALQSTPLFVELFVNDVEHDNGVIAPPHYLKDFTVPLTHLSPFKRFRLNVSRNGKVLSHNPAAASATAPSPSISTEETTLAEIMALTTRTGSVYKKTIFADKSFSVDLEWKILENAIFHVQNKEKYLSKGELSEMVLSEAKLSQRLKEKIIMLSLALGNEKCHSLLREITSLMIEGQEFLDDLDLIEVLDDVNQIEGGNQFDKVLLLLKESEKFERINKTSYPPSSFCYGIFLEFNNTQRWNLRQPSNAMALQQIDILYDKLMGWFFGQPSCHPALGRYYHRHWLRELRAQQTQSLGAVVQQASQPHSPADNVFSVILLLKDEGMLIELISRNLADYISLLRILSIAKFHQTGPGLHPGSRGAGKGSYYSKDILQVDIVLKLDQKVFPDGTVTLDLDDGCLELNAGRKNPESELYFPFKLLFEYFDGAVLSHAFHYSLHYLVEVKLLSATSFALSNALDGCFRLSLDAINGQHLSADFLLSQDSPNQPLTGPIDQTLQLLVPADIMERPESLENFAMITLAVDQPSISRPQAQAATPPRGKDSAKESAKQSAADKAAAASKRVSISFSGNSLGSSTSGLAAENRLRRMGGPMVKLGQAALFAGKDLRGEQECQLHVDRHALRLRVALKQFAFRHAALDNAFPELFVTAALADRDGLPLSPSCLPLTTGPAGSSSASTPTDSPAKKSRDKDKDKGGNPALVFRSSAAHRRAGYAWSGEAFEVDGRQQPLLDHAAYLSLELWMRSAAGGEDLPIGEALVPLSPYKFSRPMELDCLVHPAAAADQMENERVAAVLLSNSSALYGLGHLTISLHTELLADLPAAASPAGPSAQLSASGRMSSRIRSSNLVKLSLSSKPVQPTDVAWPAYILSRADKAVDPTVYFFSVSQDGLHIQADLATSSSASDKAAILEECVEKVFSDKGKLHLVVKYESIRLDEVFVLCDSALLVGLQFRRKMAAATPSSSSSASSSSAGGGGKGGGGPAKAVYRDIRFEFLIGPCLAEAIFVTLANKVSMHPLRSQLTAHVSSADKELEESFYSIAKLFQDSIYETICNISAATSDLRALEAGDSFDGRDSSGGDRKSVDSVQAEAKAGAGQIQAQGQGQGHGQAPEEAEAEALVKAAERERLALREAETRRRLAEVAEWNKLLPRLLSSRPLSSASSLSSSLALKLLYLKKATLTIYLWYLIEQSPVHISADKHYVEASWILFDEIGAHVNSDLMDTEDLDSLLFRINDIMRKLEKEVRYQVLKAFRVTNKSNDISLELSRLIYEKFIMIGSMLLGTLEYSELDFQARLKASNPSSSSGNPNPSEGVVAASYATPKSYVISNPQKKRDLIKFIIVSDNIFEEYCAAILRAHHYEFSKRPLLSLCINFDQLLEKFSTILDQNLLMWNTRIIKYFMNTRDGDSSSGYDNPSSGNPNNPSGGNPNSKADELLLLTDKNKTAALAASPSPAPVPGSSNSSGKRGGAEGGGGRVFLLPWDIGVFHEKDDETDLFVSNIPETIQLQLNVEIGLKKIAPMHLDDGRDGQGGAGSEGGGLGQDEESLYRIDLMNNKIAQAIARSYITLAAEYEKVLLSPLVQTPDAFLADLAARHLTPRSSILVESSSASPFASSTKNYAEAIEEKDELLCFLLSMINDCHRISGVHIPYSMQLFMHDYHRGRTPSARRKGARGRGSIQSTRDSFVSALGRDSLSAAPGQGQGPGQDYESMNIITFKTSLKALNAVSRKAINDLTNQIFLHCELRAYFLGGFDDFFGLPLPAAIAGANGGGNPGAGGQQQSEHGRASSFSAPGGGSRRARLYSFLAGSSSAQAQAQAQALAADRLAEENESHSTVEVMLATLSEFFDFIAAHLSPADLEKVFYLALLKLLLRFLLFLRDFHLYAAAMKKKLKKPAQAPATPAQPAPTTPTRPTAASFDARNGPAVSVQPFSDSRPVLTRDYAPEEEGRPSEADDFVQQQQQLPGAERRPSSEAAAAAAGEFRASLSARGSLAGRRSWFSFGANPFAAESFERNVFKLWSRDAAALMKFYAEAKQKLFPLARSLFGGRGGPSRGSSTGPNSAGGGGDEVEDLTAQKTASQDSAQPFSGRDRGEAEEEGETAVQLVDDEAGSPYKQTLTLLLNFATHVIALSMMDDYPGESLVNDFVLHGFGITLPSWSPDTARYQAELERLFKSDAAFIHFQPSVAVLRQQKSRVVQRFGGVSEEQSEGLGGDQGSMLDFFPSAFQSSRMPRSLCNIQVYGLAVFQVPKFKNVFLKISMADKRFVTTIAPNTSGTPSFSDIFLLDKLPISACKTLKVELFGFKLRAFRIMREHKIGEVNINLIEVLRNETANLSESPSKSALFSSPGRKKLSGQFEDGSLSSPARGEGGASFNGFTHTAWYVVSTGDRRLFADRSGPGGSDKGAAGLSYVYALASKGPREDLEAPQLRITLKTHLL